MKPQEASGDCLTLDTRFNGVLDGQGHTIYNLYCDRCAAKGFPFQGRWLGETPRRRDCSPQEGAVYLGFHCIAY